MAHKKLRLVGFVLSLSISNLAYAQMAPSAQSTALTNFVPPATVPPAANATSTPAVTAPAAVGLTVATDYIWFGNDQINDALKLIRSNRAVEALEILDSITKRNIRLPEAHLLRGIAYLQLKDLVRAEQAFNTVITIDRGYLGAYVYLSQIALQRNNMQQVQVYLQAIKAVALTEDCAEYRFVKNAMRSVPPAEQKQ